MHEAFGISRPVGRPRIRPSLDHYPRPLPRLAVVAIESADLQHDTDLDLDIVDDPGSDAAPDVGQRVCAALDTRVADAVIPCRAQLALDSAPHRDSSVPVVKGGHLSAEGMLVVAAILGVRFSFTQVATATVLGFVGSALPDDNVAPCGAMLRKFTQRGLHAVKCDMCLHECVVFRDAHRLSDPEMILQLSRAEKCPSCLTLRVDPETDIPAHVRSTRATHVQMRARSLSTPCL